MTYKMKGWSPFKIVDDKKKQQEIKAFIKKNMNKMSDADLAKAVREKSGRQTGDLKKIHDK